MTVSCGVIMFNYEGLIKCAYLSPVEAANRSGVFCHREATNRFTVLSVIVKCHRQKS